MKKSLVKNIIAGCLSAIVAVLPVGAMASDTDRIKALEAQLDQVMKRMASLEAANRDLQERVVQQSPPAAESVPSVDSDRGNSDRSNPDRINPGWKWNGDFRYRHEQIALSGTPDRERDRIQAHAGFEAHVTDTVTAGVALATGGDDPRSAMQTLTNSGSRKSVGLDLGFVRWKFAEEWLLTAGKMKYPFYRASQPKFYDSDVNPEGIALNWSRANFFASAYGFYIEERAVGSDTSWVGTQVGWRRGFGNSSMTAALAYSDLSAGAGHRPFYQQLANGNTVDASGALAYDFRIAHANIEYIVPLGRFPLTLHADYAHNGGAPEKNDAYAAGLQIGKAAKPGQWEIGYLYQRVEKDAWFGQFMDSDFGAGLTDSRGSVLRVGYALTDKFLFNATYLANEVGFSSPASADYDRLQLDLNVKY